MSRIDNYKFMAQGTLGHMKGQLHPDIHQGISTTVKEILVRLERHDEARTKIKANTSLSSTGQKEQIEAAAKTAYDAIHKIRDSINYKGHIAQLNQKIDALANPARKMEEKLLRQMQLAEIRQHLANLPDERILSIYTNATATGDLLTAEAIETAPGFLFDHALLGPLTASTQEKRRAELNPSLTGQINELERADSITRLLITDAEILLSTEADMVSDLAESEISTEAGSNAD